MTGTPDAGRVKRSVYFDRDVLAWLKARGNQLDRSVDWQIREFLRAAKDAAERQGYEA